MTDAPVDYERDFVWSPSWAMAHRLSVMRTEFGISSVRMRCSFDYEPNETLPLRIVAVPENISLCPTCNHYTSRYEAGRIIRDLDPLDLS